jgi:hypothetical protein
MGMSGLFKRHKIEPKPATRMPDPQDPEILEQRRKRIAEQRQRGGRESTIISENLTGSTGKLGA